MVSYKDLANAFHINYRGQFAQFREHMHREQGIQNVSSVILNVLSLGEPHTTIETFLNRPSPDHLAFEMGKLQYFQMIGQNNKLTLLGRRVNQMSADPLVSKMLIYGSMFGCAEDLCVVSAGLSTATLFPMTEGHKDSKKKRKKNRNHKVPTRSELIQQLTLSPTSDGLSIISAIRGYDASSDKASFCQKYLLDQKSIEDVNSLREVIMGEMRSLKGGQPRQVNLKCFQDIMAAGFLPNLAFSK